MIPSLLCSLFLFFESSLTPCLPACLPAHRSLVLLPFSARNRSAGGASSGSRRTSTGRRSSSSRRRSWRWSSRRSRASRSRTWWTPSGYGQVGSIRPVRSPLCVLCCLIFVVVFQPLDRQLREGWRVSLVALPKLVPPLQRVACAVSAKVWSHTRGICPPLSPPVWLELFVVLLRFWLSSSFVL